MRADNAGNTFNTSRSLNITSNTQTFKDWVGSSDLNDFYRFSLSSRSSFNLTLNGLSADANVQLLNSSGKAIATSTPTGTGAESLSTTLDAGNYYIQVYSSSGSTNYNLSLSATPNIYKYNFTYYYNGSNTNSDYYTGYVFAKAETYTTGTYFDFTSKNNETGANGKYYISDYSVAGSTSDLGKVFVDKYYDVDTSRSSHTPYNYSLGKASGTKYLGSEVDYVDVVNNKSYDFGKDAWELDYQQSSIQSAIQKYNFTYYYNGSNTNSDYYTGYVFAKAGTYTTGAYFDFTSKNNETGANGKYYISGSSVAGSTSDLGKVFVDKYYDVDTSRSSHTPYNFSLGKASGTKYLGSEVDYVDVVNNKSYDFGKDAWELDYVPQNVTKYNSTTGYGLINAAAAVAKALGQSTFADVPNLGGNNWGADMVKAPEVWAKGYTGQGAIVAVVDTGVDYNHPDLSTNIWTNSKEIAGNGKDDDGNGYIDDVYGWNFDGNNNNSFDDNGHGTHVAGTIAGVKNSFGVTGIAYNAKIMSVKVMDSSGQGYYSAIANGVRYAVNNGARVINLSLGGSSSDSYLQSAVQYAASKGAIVVMAAGNNGGSVPDYPARYAENWGLAVGAVDKYNNLASFSNRAGTNPLAYVTAPGVNIYSTIPGNKYASYSGTSMATPHVAGVVALMLSANPNLTDSQVRQIITQISGTTTQSKVATTTYTANGDAATFRISASSFSSNNIATSSDTVISSTSSNSVDKNNLFENLHTWTDFGNDYKHSVVDTSYISISSEEYTEAENIVKNGKKPLETVYEIVG